MLSRCKTIFALILCPSFLFLAASGTQSAQAVAPGLKSAEKGEKSKEVEELHKAKGLLEKADHDYDGHRHKAIEDIDKAIHTLHHHGKAEKGEKKGEKKGEEKKGEDKGKEPQKKSDEQLHEAVKILEGVEKQLHANHAKGAGEHHGKAAEDVKRAIEQLRDALKIK